jgi:hypothetical protein
MLDTPPDCPHISSTTTLFNDFPGVVTGSPQVKQVPLKFLPQVKQEPCVDAEEVASPILVTSTSQEECKEEKFVVPGPSKEMLPGPSRKRTSSRLTSIGSSSYYQSDDDDVESSVNSPYYSKRARGAPRKIKEETDDEDGSIASSAASCKEKDMREKNNLASKRSRRSRKQREMDMEREADELTAKNKKLQDECNRLDHLVLSMRKTLIDFVRKNA